MLELFSQPETWMSLATLTFMEVVLGIDNIIFISILAERLPVEHRKSTRIIGLAIACVMRLGLLLAIGWIVGLTQPLFSILGHPIAGRDMVLLGGGLFLIYKATVEIHHKLEGEDEAHGGSRAQLTVASALVQIILLDMVFSLDSILTAVGMAQHVSIMMIAVVISLAIMIALGGPISDFVMRHPSVKMLALSFLLLIGVTLVADGFGVHVDKAYIYAAIAFSVFVEFLNLRARRNRQKRVAVELHPTFVKDEPEAS